MKIKNSKGFTLIELLIVIAIIAILAAIAIPQFGAYRIKGYNASATSDIHNIALQEAAVFADWQRFGHTVAPAALPGAGGFGAGVLLTGPTPGGGNFNMISLNDNAGTPRGLEIPLGNTVSAVAGTDNPGAPAGGSTYVAVTKHLQGDATYGADSDSTALYKNTLLHLVGAALAVADCPAATAADDIALLGANWVKM